MTPDTSAKTPVREIKFRCWSKTRKEMEYDCGHKVDPDLYELMQYTGLKDKAGKEVYEGDIVNCTKGCPHEIIWNEEYAGTYIGGLPAWNLSGLNVGYAWTGQEEIIGNKFENPELLPSK